MYLNYSYRFVSPSLININLEISNGEKEKKFNDIIYGCKIDNILNNRDINLNSIISENGKNLSGGERQRIALARALSTNSYIYFFDEATNQLDKKSELEIMEYVWRILEDKTCISIMHDLNLLKKQL